jgi:hypothetical protein
VNFSAAGSMDPDGDPLTYTWNWGDGTSGGSGTLVNTSHFYTTPSGSTSPITRTATLTVSDGRASDTRSVNITVTPPPAGVLSCNAQVVNLWGNNYQLNVNVANNTSVTVSDWCVILGFSEPAQMTSGAEEIKWSGGSTTTVRGCRSGGPIVPGESINIGLQGTHDGSFTTPTCRVAMP